MSCEMAPQRHETRRDGDAMAKDIERLPSDFLSFKVVRS